MTHREWNNKIMCWPTKTTIRRVSTLLLCASVLTACGGGSNAPGVSPPPPPPPPPPANSAPTINGIPDTTIEVGQLYEFLPTANDADNDPLTFTISGQPDWATFDTDTGLLEGMPDVDDIDVFDNIVITVSDGLASSSLAAFSITVEPESPVQSPTGLDSRPANLTCLAVDPAPSSGISLQRVFPGLTLDNLTAVAQTPGGTRAWYFATRDGLIGRFANNANVSSFTTVLDLRGTVLEIPDGGLVQLVIHPDFPTDRRVFVNYSTDPLDGVSVADVVISSFILSSDGLSIDPQSEVELIRYARGRNHQGGFIAFDDNGLLLAAFGDGTDQRDPTGRAQDLDDIRGKVIRINVDNGSPYSIPASNPYAGSGGSPLREIYAYGFRNPFRGDIDPATGRIFIGDVGLNQREEVTEVFSGGNHGWNIKEGNNCFSNLYGNCNDPTLIDPLIDYPHEDGNCSVIGGYFYRGQAIPELDGKFIFADFCTGKISAVDFSSGGQPSELILIPGGSGAGSIYTFAKDRDGEIYAVTNAQIHKIIPASGNQGSSGPAAQLSQTGCFDPADASVPAAGLIPYDLQNALWSDAASKRRWIALPNGRTIDLLADGDFEFPEGTVLVKEFSIEGQRIETRLLMKDSSSVWKGYSYEWNGNDATLLQGSKQKLLSNGQTWGFPSRGECLRCHTDAAGFALGPEIAQLNGDMVYTETNRISNQLATFEHIGLFTNGLPDTPDQLPAMAGIDDTHQAVSRQARSYIHSNCSGCHRGEGPTQSNMDLRFATSRTDMNVCNLDPGFGDLGTPGAKILDPGNPANSIIIHRPSSTDPQTRMPPLGTSLVDNAAMAVLTSWIASPDVCVVESDADLDQVPDDADNCPNTANPDQSDIDKDGLGDKCDAN
jgi:uncharacterized repeat protein (TIGR03806 family)